MAGAKSASTGRVEGEGEEAKPVCSSISGHGL